MNQAITAQVSEMTEHEAKYALHNCLAKLGDVARAAQLATVCDDNGDVDGLRQCMSLVARAVGVVWQE